MGYRLSEEELLSLRHRILVSLMAKRHPKLQKDMEVLAKHIVQGFERDEEPWEDSAAALYEASVDAVTAYDNAIRLGKSADEARSHAVTYIHLTLVAEVERYLSYEPPEPGN